MKRILPIFIAVSAWSQSGIEVPSVGLIVDPSGSLRSVQGVAGNFMLGQAVATGVLSAACSERLCLAKTNLKILSATGQVDAPPGPAIFGFDGDHAIVFFAESRAFARWNKDQLDPLDWAGEGEVLSIRVSDEGLEVALRRDWAGVTNGSVLLLKDGVLFATEDELILRRRDASETRFELTGAESISAMGPHYAAIRAGAMTFALRLDPGHEQLFLLPGSTP
jgi:hypothetical protein